MTHRRIMHIADAHLGSPLHRLGQHGIPQLMARTAIEHAFTRCIDSAVTHNVDLIVIAGDLFDGDADPATVEFCHSQLQRLAIDRENPIPAVVIRGNHDAGTRLRRAIHFPHHVHELSTASPERKIFPDLGIEVIGQGFSVPEITHDLTTAYPSPTPGLFTIGMLHTALEGSAQHASYAPTTVNNLSKLGYDYWALGHVHEYSDMQLDYGRAVYPGCIQGRSVRETGPKGCVIIDVMDGVLANDITWIPTGTITWHSLTVDLTGCMSETQARQQIRATIEEAVIASDVADHFCRVHLTGETSLSELWNSSPETMLQAEELVRAAARDVSTTGPTIWVERIRLRLQPPLPARELLAAGHDAAAAFINMMNERRFHVVDSAYDQLQPLAHQPPAPLQHLAGQVSHSSVDADIELAEQHVLRALLATEDGELESP